MIKHFVDAVGRYLGTWDTPETEYPADAVEIDAPPEDAADVWNGETWDTSGRKVVVDNRKAAIVLILEELKTLRPAKAVAIQNLIDRIQGEE